MVFWKDSGKKKGNQNFLMMGYVLNTYVLCPLNTLKKFDCHNDSSR